MVVSDISLSPGCTANGDRTADPFCVDTTTAAGATCEVTVDCDDLVAESDRRLKTDISQTGVAANGLPLYRFRYLDGAQYYEGVMAQDVLAYNADAVLVGADGYYRVDYGQLGLRMRAVD